MPEGLEAELYRRTAAGVVGRVVATVEIDPRQPQANEIRGSIPGRTVLDVGRLGKQVWLSFDAPAGQAPLRLGMHFGMAGRVAVDGVAAIDTLAYSSDRWNPEWTRLQLDFTAASGGGTLVVNDPRRWSRFTLDPELGGLGPDLFAVSGDELWHRLQRRRTSIKTVLLDQSVVAGLGNMLVDEVLWEAGIDPRRPANELERVEVDRIVEVLDARLPVMLAAGGSHSGQLHPERRQHLGPCPRNGCHDSATDAQSPLVRDSIGGRTTIWCPGHQR